MTLMYRFRSKLGEWVWLRTQAFAFLNPYTDDIEYIVSKYHKYHKYHKLTNSPNAQVCTNSPAKSNSLSGPVDPVSAPAADYRHAANPGAGLDYSIPGRQVGSAANAQIQIRKCKPNQNTNHKYIN
jgi:hypothetical protein